MIFLVDCGRMMTNEAAGLSLLDHALNAMLMLSYVALRQGDSVGLLCFSDEIHGFVPPRGGMNQMNQLLHASFDRFPRLVESRYDQAFLYLAAHCRKRSLVVLITNVIDEVNANQIQQYLRIARRPAPAAGRAAARSPRCSTRPTPQPDGRRALYRAAAAAEILTWRQQVLADLDARACLSLDVFPEEHDRPAGEPLPGHQGPAFAVDCAVDATGLLAPRELTAHRSRPHSEVGPVAGCCDRPCESIRVGRGIVATGALVGRPHHGLGHGRTSRSRCRCSASSTCCRCSRRSEAVTRHLHEYFDEVARAAAGGRAAGAGRGHARTRSPAGPLAIAARRNAHGARPAVHRRHERRRSAGRRHARAQAEAGLHARPPGRGGHQRSRGRPLSAGVPRPDRGHRARRSTPGPRCRRSTATPLAELPRVNVSVKLSALYSQFDPIDPDGHDAPRGRAAAAAAARGRASTGRSSTSTWSSTHQGPDAGIFQQVLMEDEFRDCRDVGIVIQCYLQGRRATTWSSCATGPRSAARRSGCGWSRGRTGTTRRCTPRPSAGRCRSSSRSGRPTPTSSG